MSTLTHHVLNPLIDMCRKCGWTRELIEDAGGTFEYGQTIDSDYEVEAIVRAQAKQDARVRRSIAADIEKKVTG